MPKVYVIKGFTQYLIIDKILYKLPKVCKHQRFKFQYRGKRKIKIALKNNNKGYYLTKQGETKFYTLKSLKHKLKLITLKPKKK